MELVLIVLAVLLLFYLTRSEKLVGAVDDSQYTMTVASVTPDKNQAMIFLARDYLKKYMNICAYCIETRSVQQLTNIQDNSVKYRCSYTFVVFGGFPYGITVNTEIVLDPAPAVLLLSTQPLTSAEGAKIAPYTNEIAQPFLSYDEIYASIKPQKLPTVS
jgi:hypothetical protein